MFSTDLGRLAPRKLQGPPYTPVIVRSDRVQDVVTAAQLWLKKYPVQYLCIFPQSGWQIGDLWDEQDIHLETESFCKEVLKFIERDNYIRARDYAHQWSKTYPERLDVVGADMSVLYDPNDHLSIVDKIFVNGEMDLYPRIFLWHVAHNMRTAMLEVKGMRVPTKESVSAPARLNTGSDEPIKSGAAKVLGTAEEIVAMPSSSYTKAKCKNNPFNTSSLTLRTNCFRSIIPCYWPTSVDACRSSSCNISPRSVIRAHYITRSFFSRRFS